MTNSDTKGSKTHMASDRISRGRYKWGQGVWLRLNDRQNEAKGDRQSARDKQTGRRAVKLAG